MREKEMEDLLWEHPGKLLNEPLTKFERQPASAVGRADLVFVDRIGRLLVVEIKRGKLPREAVPQLVDYRSMLKLAYPDRSVELMVVANQIPQERLQACDQFDIEAREISEKKFRDVAEEVGYEFGSEASPAGRLERESASHRDTSSTSAIPGSLMRRRPAISPNTDRKAWHYWEEDGISYILAFVNQFDACSKRRWDANSGDFLDKTEPNPSGDYQQNFSEYLKSGMALRLSRQPNLERDCKLRLPDWVMDEIAPQIHRFKAR